MATVEREVYEVFRSLGVDEDRALKAASTLSRGGMDLSSVKGEVMLLKWMVGFGLALNVAILLKLFVH